MDIPQVVSESVAEVGEMGQQYLATGKAVALRRWAESAGAATESTQRNYETVGYVLSGRLELELACESVQLQAGDSWLVPAGALHRYTILEDVIAIEATSPPARFNDRDQPTNQMTGD